MHSKRLLFAILLSVLPASLAVAAQQGITKRTLPNGLDVIAIQNRAVPLVTIEVAVKNGAFTEPPEYDGLSHLYEHMFFKGNQAIPTQEAYMDRVHELGMNFNGTTGTERVNYFFTLHKDNLREGLVFMKDAIRFPLFDQTELEKEREVVLSEYDRNESQPLFFLRRETSQALWGDYYSRKNSIGNREVIQTTTPEKMRTIQQRYYHPNNSALLISGDIDPAQVFQLAEELYADWPAGPNPFEQHPVPAPEPLSDNKALIVNRPIRTAAALLQMMGPSVTTDPKATFAADVFSFILQQPTSVFHKNLIDSGLAVRASMGYFTQAHTGPIYMQIVASPDKLKDAVAALYKEVDQFTNPEYFTDEQLETAKAMLETSEIFGREKPSDFVHTVSFWWAVAGLDYYDNYVQNLRAVTRQDIHNYLNTYVINKPFVIGALLSEENQTQIALKEEDLLP
ncbi:MAG: pitrilysin family protein [bacterium]|nr:pitrilysin family protein [bacterium]